MKKDIVRIIGHDRVLIRLAKPYFINGAVKAQKKRSIHLVCEEMLPEVDVSGSAGGARDNKFTLFEYPTYQYLRTGDGIGKCLSFQKK